MGAERMVLRMRALAWVCVVAISLTCLSAPDLEYEARQYEDQVTEIPTTEFRGIYDPLVLKMPEIPKTHKTKSFNVKIPPIKAYHFPLKKKVHIRKSLGTRKPRARFASTTSVPILWGIICLRIIII